MLYKCRSKYLFVLLAKKNLFFFYFPSTEHDLQFLHQLPSGLLKDILSERYEQPAFLDKDNVNEFRKVYDDFYGRNQPVTGRKKVPPTKPYVQLLMLYDLLKREAKKLMLNKFQVKTRLFSSSLSRFSSLFSSFCFHSKYFAYLLCRLVCKFFHK